MEAFNIICSDGGLRGGFIAGVLEQLLIEHPDLIAKTKAITATSASVGTVSYFISFGKDHPGDKIWVNELSSKKFSPGVAAIFAILMGKSIYDVDYLIDTVFHDRHPLDVKAIHNSSTTCIFPIFNLQTMEIEFFWNRKPEVLEYNGHYVFMRDLREHDYYEVMRAAKAVPILYDKSIMLGEVPYIDAGQLEPYTIDAPETVGLKKILIATKYKCDWTEAVKYKIAGVFFYILSYWSRSLRLPLKVYTNVVDKPTTYARLSARVDRMVEAGELLLITPNGKLRNRTQNSIADLNHNYDMGRSWVASNRSVIDSFKSISNSK